MAYRWENHKNNFLVTYNDQMLLAQLPATVQIQLYTEFVFKDFLWKFRRFFMISNEMQSFMKMTKITYPYFTYENEGYSLFMINFMNHLETSFYQANDTIANELDESLEVLFVEQGRY